MKKLTIILISALMGLFNRSFSQVKSSPVGPGLGKVSGTVVDGSSKIVESATITLLRIADSSVVKMSVAGKNGQFLFESIADGKYIVSITAVDHQKGFSETFEINPSSSLVILKPIQLVPLAKSMTGVTVVSKRPLIEQKIDRTIVNVEASITNVGNSALEVLEKSPGITVDKDGNISLKGKQGVVVMIDGRPSYLSGPDLANMLRSMTASQLDQIEIMTNPPAKYDAAGNSGVINIKTKKSKLFGYNGSITGGFTQGKFPRFNDGASFNYRNGKLNFFSNFSQNYNHRAEELDIVRNFRDSQTKDLLSSFDQVAQMRNEGVFYSGKLGLDYVISKKTTIGFVVNGFYNPKSWLSNSETNIYDPNGIKTKQTKAASRNDNTWKNMSGNLNLLHTFDSTGQEITVDLDYIEYNSKEAQWLISDYYDANGIRIQKPDTLLASLPQHIRIYSGKSDYTLPLKKDAKFEAGVKTSFVNTDNNATYNDLVLGNEALDSSRYNHFVYTENINAAYINFSKPFTKKISAQLGLRAENTISKGHSTGFSFDASQNKFVPFDSLFKRDYTQLFPTAYLQYKANGKNQFVLNYGRRIERPDYEDLNPFQHFIDRYTYEQGNPNLKPQFSHNIELTHTYNNFLNTTLNYSSTKDIIQQVLEQNENTNETFIKKANIASMRQYGIAISASKEITKWWSGNIYLNVYNNHYKGIVNNDYISIGITGAMMQLQQQFKWSKTWSAELSGFYRTKSVEGVIFVQPIAQVNAGFSKQIMKNKASLRLNVRDIFAGSRFKGYSKYSNIDARFTDINDSRAVSFSFTYRFNKGKLKAGSNKKASGASDEQNRVKAGGN